MTTSRDEAPGFLIQGGEAYKLAQALYHVVTGKTETLSKQFSDNYRVTLDDLKQLHAKLDQMCTQWTVIESNENITIFHIDDNKEVFSSIDRLQLYDSSKSEPVESISFEFNVLVSLPVVKKPQPYKITIRITSKIAAMHKSEKEGVARALYRLFRSGVISIEIEYVDYVVARNMLSTLDSWVKEIEVAKKQKALELLQKHSHWAPKIASLVLFLVAVYAAVISADLVSFPAADNAFLAKYLLSSFGFIVGFFFLGVILGGFVEGSVDRVEEVSYINLNKGDQKLLAEFQKRNTRSVWKAVISFFFITVHAVACSYIAAVMFQALTASANRVRAGV